MASLPGHRRADEDADRGAAPACLPHPMALHGAAASPSVSDPNGWPQSGCRRDVEQGRGEFGPPHGDAPAASRAQSISHADSLAPERHASPQPPHWQRGRASRQGSASLHALRSADRLPAASRAKRRYGPALASTSSTPGRSRAAGRPRGPASSTTRLGPSATALTAGPASRTSPALSSRTTRTLYASRLPLRVGWKRAAAVGAITAAAGRRVPPRLGRRRQDTGAACS